MKRISKKLTGVLVAILPLLTLAGDVVEFKAVQGDGVQCPSGYEAVSAFAALNYKDAACRAIGADAGARLSDKAAMSGASGGCNIYSAKIDKKIPTTLCYRVEFKETEGDQGAKCPSNMRLATVAEAVAFNKQACNALSAKYNIARLASGGSIGGSGYDCVVHGSDTEGKGHSLCLPK
jgi:hypothetical protein